MSQWLEGKSRPRMGETSRTGWRNDQLIQKICHVRWRPLYRLRAGWPLMTAPQPVRNQGCLHMSKAHRHRRLTLIMRSGFPHSENPLVLSHYCRGLKYSRPRGITLDAAAIRPSSLWNCFTVSDFPSLTLATAERINSIRAGNICAYIAVEISGSLSRIKHTFLGPSILMWARMTSRCWTATCSDWARINQLSM